MTRTPGIAGVSAKSDLGLRPSAPQEKFHRIAHTLSELVRSGKVHGPLADDGVEKSFHEFGQMHHRKIAGDFAIFLTLRDNFAEKADGCGFRSTQFRRAHWIHRAG